MPINKLMTVRIFYMFLFSLLATGCAKKLRNANTIPWATCQPNSEITADQIAQWNLQCATFQVPLDYSNPNGQQINLALIRRPAIGSGNYIGTIITNPGGPGGSGVADLAGSSEVYSSTFKGYFDQVSFDPRGIGLSEPFINCHNNGTDDYSIGDELNGSDPGLIPPTTPAPLSPNGDLDNVIDATKKIWGICETNFANVLPFMGTQNVARDMERIRIALGSEKLNFVGYSYGTLLGAVYGMLFPENIRAMVLDGSVPPASTLFSQGVDSTQSYENTLVRMLSECDTNPNCALYGNAVTAFTEVLNYLQNMHNMTASTPYGNLSALTSGWFITAVADGIALDWPGVTEGIAEAWNGGNLPGDGSMLLAMGASAVGRSEDNTYDNSNEMYDIVQCNDFSDRPNTDLVTALIENLIPITSPTSLAPYMGPYGIRISTLLCIGTSIPLLPPDPVPPISYEGPSPILVIGNITDPETPYIWGQALATAIKNSALLTWNGGNHTVFAEGVSDCIDNATMDYLIRVVLPPNGTVCPEGDPWG